MAHPVPVGEGAPGRAAAFLGRMGQSSRYFYPAVVVPPLNNEINTTAPGAPVTTPDYQEVSANGPHLIASSSKVTSHLTTRRHLLCSVHLLSLLPSSPG